MAGTSNSITTHNVLSGVLNADNVISGLVNTAFNPAYALVTQAGAQIVLFINNNDYKMYAQLKDKSGNLIYTSNIIDLPLETMVVDGRYDSNTKKLILVLDNGNEIEVPLEALINGLVNEDDLIANYYDKDEIDALLDGYWTKIELTQEDIDNWNAKQEYLNQGDGIEISAETTLKGNTSQESTTGKNKLAFDLATMKSYNSLGTWNNNVYSLRGLTATINDDGTFRVSSGTTTDTFNFYLYRDKTGNRLSLNAGTYTFSSSSVPNTGNGNLVFKIYDNEGQAISGVSNVYLSGSTTSATRTINENFQVAVYLQISNGATETQKDYAIQIETGNEATSYEPYTNGASPNPDYPQDIQVVSGNNTIKVYGGENLFTTIMEQNAWTFGDGDSYTSPNYIRTQGKISVEAGKTYILSFDGVKPTDNNSGFVFYNNGTFVSGLQTTNLEVTIPNGANQMVYNLYRKGGIVPSDISNIRLYRIDQTYPISLGNIELCKIGDYQDKIYKDSGKWYLNKQIGKVVLNGSEDWAISNNIFYRTQSSYVGVGYNIISNYFIGGPNQASTTNVNNYNPNNSICCASGGTNRFYIKTNIASTTTDFKTWLSTHNTEVYYVLATPTITEITDTTLIEQLDNLSIGLSNKWIKNISQTNAEIPFELEYDNTNLTISASSNLVRNTDYATSITGGIVKVGNGVYMNSGNWITTTEYTYSNYQNAGNGVFIGKGTLENVITGKDLTTKAYVDAANAAFESELFDDGVISIEDSTEANINNTMNKSQLKIDLKGNTYQYSTTGKNLFDNVYGQTGNVYTKYINAPSPLGSVGCYPINLLPNTQYTLKIDMNGYQKTGAWIAGVCFENGDVISLLQSNSMEDITTTTFTTDSTGVVYVGHRYGFSYGETGRMDLFLQTAKIQLEKGSTATEYEPYTNGASPNPDYPQDIHVVSGDNSIYITNNLFDKNNALMGYYVNQLNGELVQSSNRVSSEYISVKPNTNYIFSNASDISTNGKGIAYYNENKQFISGAIISNFTNGKFTTPANCKYIIYSYDKSGNWTNLMLNEGDIAKPYESATYPISLGNIELCKIGTYQDKIAKSTGKNLCNLENLKLIVNSNGVVVTNNAYWNVIIDTRNENSIYIKGNYSLLQDSVLRIGGFNEYPQLNSQGTRITYSGSASLDTSTYNYVLLCFGIGDNHTIDEIRNSFMINEGSTALPYEPYGKVWYLNKQIGKVVLDGSENWGLQSINSYGIANFNRTINDFIPISQTENYSKNDRFTPQNSLISGTQTEGYLMNNAKQLYVRISSNRANTVETFKAWLSNNNTTLYYVLATPTITEITDTTLIEQLDNLENAYSYDTQTNISQTNADKPFILDVNAIADNVNGLKLENENQEYKTNKVIELSSNSTDDEYPSAKCVYDIVGNIEAVLAAMDSGSGV